jgi:hypothetical protein
MTYFGWGFSKKNYKRIYCNILLNQIWYFNFPMKDYNDIMGIFQDKQPLKWGGGGGGSTSY